MPVILVPLPAVPPVIPPVTTGALQVYVVPVGTILPLPFAGITAKATSPQVEVVWFKIEGVGSTVTVTVNVAPAQLPDVGVTVYVNVADALVVLVKVWLIELWPVACALPPVIAPTGLLTGFVHVKVVPVGIAFPPTPSTGVTVKAVPLQMVAA